MFINMKFYIKFINIKLIFIIKFKKNNFINNKIK